MEAADDNVPLMPLGSVVDFRLKPPDSSAGVGGSRCSLPVPPATACSFLKIA